MVKSAKKEGALRKRQKSDDMRESGAGRRGGEKRKERREAGKRAAKAQTQNAKVQRQKRDPCVKEAICSKEQRPGQVVYAGEKEERRARERTQKRQNVQKKIHKRSDECRCAHAQARAQQRERQYAARARGVKRERYEKKENAGV